MPVLTRYLFCPPLPAGPTKNCLFFTGNGSPGTPETPGTRPVYIRQRNFENFFTSAARARALARPRGALSPSSFRYPPPLRVRDQFVVSSLPFQNCTRTYTYSFVSYSRENAIFYRITAITIIIIITPGASSTCTPFIA